MKNNYIFGLLYMIKRCVSVFLCACERTRVGILECACVSACLLEFCIEPSLNMSPTSPGGEKEKPFSYQVKSHGRLNSLYHPAAAHAWLE